MKWRRYPKYKDSGIGWLGEVPEHWHVDRLKWTVRSCRNGIWGDEPNGDDDLLCIRVADFDRQRFSVSFDRMTLRSVTPAERRNRLLSKGDLLLEKSGGGDLQPVGAVVSYDHSEPAVCSNFVAKMDIADDCDSRYQTYLHAHLYAGRVNTRSIKQTTGIQNLDADAYLSEPVCYPGNAEQHAIATFLDRETARIDALIEKKQRQIELLQEKRAALISHAVTKGLEPNVKMKDSGIEWLGEVPEHWAIPPLYAHYNIELGKMLDSKRITGETSLPYLRNIDVQWDFVNTVDLPEMDIEPTEYERYTLRAGDLLVCEGGEVGRAAIWQEELSICGYQKAIHRVRPRDERSVPRFFFYMMRAAAHSGVFLANGNPNTIPHLTREQFRVYRFPFPPAAEQREIAAYLDGEIDRIEDLARKLNASIDTLREYRTALISAAVTGKIDVREEAA